jgi:hypothetical protein
MLFVGYAVCEDRSNKQSCASCRLPSILFQVQRYDVGDLDEKYLIDCMRIFQTVISKHWVKANRVVRQDAATLVQDLQETWVHDMFANVIRNHNLRRRWGANGGLHHSDVPKSTRRPCDKQEVLHDQVFQNALRAAVESRRVESQVD